MKCSQFEVADELSLMMLKKGCPVSIGMPAAVIQEFVFGKNPALTIKDVFGLSKRYRGRSLFEEHLSKQGYCFSFGTVSEESRPSDPDDDESLPVVRYEFVPTDLLVAFPQCAQLQDLFMMMYRNHPRYDCDFSCDEGYGDMSVISFESEEGEESSLRSWIANTFIPKIWPDLLAEAKSIVDVRKTATIAMFGDDAVREMLVERSRNQLCNDPTELSFYAG